MVESTGLENQRRVKPTQGSNPCPSATIRFTLIVQDTGQAADLAQRFVAASLSSGHHIEQVFFYHDAVFEADSNRAGAQDDPKSPYNWPDLAAQGSFPLNVCIAAGARRGVLSDAEAVRHHQKALGNLTTPFELVGLGVLIEGLMNGDRVITFGN